jgi:folate-dependent phosphoribosylglycinamide formyltransferase PurN
MSSPRVVLLTGDGLRHAYVAQQLSRRLNLVGVLCEAKAAPVERPQALPEIERAIIERHFIERDEVERRMLGGTRMSPDAETKAVSHGSANSPEAYAWVRHLQPDYVVLFGSSIIKSPLLDDFDGHMINIHSGLSPYYRGGATNFWPLYYGEPECVGTTIHLADAGVDAGPILAQVRPQPDLDDRVHELGTKALMAGVELLPRALEAWSGRGIQALAQDLSGGRVCRRRDFSAAAVRQVWDRLDRGMMAEYLGNLAGRQAKFPLVALK